ncbi:MAG: UDP-glucose 4-epimerase GalE [Gammaproteobacteria bacterium]|nr:UDP-glucose 4-epimerase GalE [Gammaproteobacteria bacterium]
MAYLIVGGAGYIGSHMCLSLVQAGQNVIVLDDLSTGYRDAVNASTFVEGSLADVDLLDRIFTEYKIDAVMHFASFIQVGESVREPQKYYQNNFINTLNLLNAMVKHGVKKFIFSSTAAIFGEPLYVPIDLAHPKNPINPYGRSKWMVEQVLEDYDKAYGLKSICLRYFNVAGADPKCRVGERHEPETHLIPLVLRAASGKMSSIKVFGRDYDTPDGTCIRDYIHVMDLCQAHFLAIEYLQSNGKSAQFNLGNGNGFSVQEVIDAAIKVTGKSIQVIDEARRAGDPARLVADSSVAIKELGWKPEYPNLHDIIQHAWAWELKSI